MCWSVKIWNAKKAQTNTYMHMLVQQKECQRSACVLLGTNHKHQGISADAGSCSKFSIRRWMFKGHFPKHKSDSSGMYPLASSNVSLTV